MNKTAIKTIAMLLLSFGIAAGCATQPEEPAGPTQAELEAQRAQAEAERRAAENAACMERAEVLMEEVTAYSNLNSDQQDTLDAAEAAMQNDEGCRARDLLASLASELEAAMMTYTVVRGDSLWGIAGKSEVYGNAYQWPLIYKANSDKINDADLIFPGQEFDVDKNPTSSEVDSAVNHAKTRGAWSIGESEASDSVYLSN